MPQKKSAKNHRPKKRTAPSKGPDKFPHVEDFLEKARELIREHGKKRTATLNHIKYNHRRFQTMSLADIADCKIGLNVAKTVVARIEGYAGWSELRSHLKALSRPGKNLARDFEQAADAVVDGDINLLTKLLDENPRLVEQRSYRSHGATLLHYIAANGVEQRRQKTPPNAVQICQLLLDHGAEPDALAGTYEADNNQTTLSLLVSSTWPDQAGLQGPLIKTLCDAGANPDGLDGDGTPLAMALVFFYEKAARALASCGSRTNHLLAAAAVGSARDVDACFTSTGKLKRGKNRSDLVYIGFQLRPAKTRLELMGQAITYAAMCGNLATIKRLVNKHRCPVDAAADRGIRALHLAAYKGHEEIVEWLLKKGADGTIRDDQWHTMAPIWAKLKGHKRIRKKIIASIDLDVHLAVEFSQVKELKKLLLSNPDLAVASSEDGRQPLHFLNSQTESGEAMIDLLVACGADIKAKDPNGRTAAERLSVVGRDDLVAKLR